jgi:hypothetical protein
MNIDSYREPMYLRKSLENMLIFLAFSIGWLLTCLCFLRLTGTQQREARMAFISGAILMSVPFALIFRWAGVILLAPYAMTIGLYLLWTLLPKEHDTGIIE